MTLLEVPGLTTRNKKLLGPKGIATRSKDASRLRLLHLWGTSSKETVPLMFAVCFLNADVVQESVQSGNPQK